jgi:transformation/transcription domain-associated protein
MQALTFIQVCLSAVLNLRLPDQSALPANIPADQQGTPMEQLATVLLEGGHPPMIRPVASRVELGVKTKTQLVAEKAVLTSLLTAVISAAGDDVLAEQAVPFCRSICRCAGPFAH